MIALIVGTRPEIIKLYPLVLELIKKKIKFKIIHTGQHYSKSLNDIFLKKFKKFKINYNLRVGSFTTSIQTALMMDKLEKIFKKEFFKLVIVYGDTNSALAGALVVSKIKKTKLIHIEAGLRSFEKKMPEEINRKIIDHISDYLFAPTKISYNFLLKENIHKSKIFFTGNLISDSIKSAKNKISKSILQKLRLIPYGYFITTFHREENLSNLKRLVNILKLLGDYSNYFKVPIIFPCHPNTMNRIAKNKLTLNKNIKIINPLDYYDFLSIINYSKLVISDSGGIQEECCILKKKNITIRSSTERQETVKIGGNSLIDINKNNILNTKKFLLKKNRWFNPYGKGNISKKMVLIIKSLLKKND